MTSNGVRRNCPVCKGEDSCLWMRKRGLEVVQCVHCSMRYVDPAPEALANGSYYEESAGELYLSAEKLAGDQSPVRYRREIRLLRKHCRSGRILDVGCSTGGFLYYLEQKYPGEYQLYGTDVASAALDFAENNGVPVLRIDFFAENFADEPFDAITFWAVLEHVVDPRRFLERAAELLRPGGHCFVLVPNVGSLATRVLDLKYRYILPQHLNYFSSGTLRGLVTGLFEVERCTTTHFNPAVIWQDWRSKAGEPSDSDRARLLRRTNALKENPALAPLRLVYGAVERVLGSAGLADNLAMVLRRT